jgi:hypothetical protein
MIDPYLAVPVVEVVAEEGTDFLVLHRFQNTNLFQTVGNDVAHSSSTNLVYLIYLDPVLNDLVIK